MVGAGHADRAARRPGRRRPAAARPGNSSPPSRRASPDKAGILSAWVGTMLVMLVTALAAVPLGIAAGVYLEEYAPQELDHRPDRDQHRQPRRRAVHHLRPDGARPVRLPVRPRPEHPDRRSDAGLLILPIVIIATREAIRAIPSSIREAAYALGATKWQTVRDHVLPYSDGRHPDRRHHRPVARHRRNRAADHHRRARPSSPSCRRRRSTPSSRSCPSSG